MIEIARTQSGRVAVIVPHGVLFRGGSEGKIRQALIEENLLDAVVGLPANLFTTTGIPVAILVFDRSREQGGAERVPQGDPVYRRQQGVHAEQDAEPDVRCAYSEGSRHLSHARRTRQVLAPATPEEIKENEYNLNIPRYVDTFEPEEEIDVAALQKEIDRIEGELAEVRGRMAGYLKELGVHVER